MLIERYWSISGFLSYAEPSFTYAGPMAGVAQPFTENDIRQVLAYWSESTEGYGEEEIRVVVSLENGQFAFMAGGCDTTGWDCQSSGIVKVADSVEDLVAYAMEPMDRERLLNELEAKNVISG